MPVSDRGTPSCLAPDVQPNRPRLILQPHLGRPARAVYYRGACARMLRSAPPRAQLLCAMLPPHTPPWLREERDMSCDKEQKRQQAQRSGREREGCASVPPRCDLPPSTPFRRPYAALPRALTRPYTALTPTLPLLCRPVSTPSPSTTSGATAPPSSEPASGEGGLSEAQRV